MDAGATTVFLKSLFDNDNIMLDFFSKNPTRSINRTFRATQGEAIQSLANLESQGFDNFIGINTGRERTNGGITHYHALFLDVDLRKGQQCPSDFALPPHFAVKTGGGWHIYWLLSSGSNITLWKQVQKAMARKYNTDESVALATQLARIPGCIYHKTKTNRLGGDRINQIIRNPKSFDRRFGLDEFAKSFTLELVPAPVFHARELTQAKGGCASLRAKQYLSKMEPATEGSYGSLQTFKACKVGTDFGVDEAEFWPMLLEFNGRCVPPWNEEELSKKLSSAYRCTNKPFGWRMSA